MGVVQAQALETGAYVDDQQRDRQDLDGLPRVRARDPRVDTETPPVITRVVTSVTRELGPGLAKRAKQDGRTPANWFSVDYETARAIAETAHTGDLAYGPDNWRKGIPASNLINHAMEHLFLLLEGDSTEPHLEHAMWNLGKLRWMVKHYPELIDVGQVRKSVGLPPLEDGNEHR